VGKPTKTKTDRKTLPAGIAKVLKRLHYPLDVILLSVRWYVAYSLSLRNLEEMIAERGFEVDHSTVHRWVIKLVPLFEKAFRKHKRPVGKSWRMDETYVKVRGQWKYLYRAVDKAGNTVDFLLRAHRDKAAAHRYFDKAIDRNGEPETITVDKSGANLAARRSQRGSANTNQGPTEQVPEQRRRAGSPWHQTHHQADDGLQGFSLRPHHPDRHRSHAYDSQRANARRWHSSNSAEKFYSIVI
jgi:transposase-like protein